MLLFEYYHREIWLSGNWRGFVIPLTLRRFLQTLISWISNRLRFNKIGSKFKFYQLPRQLPESHVSYANRFLTHLNNRTNTGRRMKRASSIRANINLGVMISSGDSMFPSSRPAKLYAYRTRKHPHCGRPYKPTKRHLRYASKVINKKKRHDRYYPESN